MNVQILTLCDAATVDAGGKLNILGAFDSIFALQEPIVHTSCVLAVKMRFDQIEEGDKTVKIMFVDHDGKEVFPSQTLNVSVKMPPNSRSGTVQIVATIQQLQLPHFVLVGSLPLFATRIVRQSS